MERYENPCTPERCDVSHCCSKGTDAMPQTWEYWRTCTTYALYLGHQEGYAAGQSELTALRAEVEVMRRALEALAEKMQGQSMDCWRCPMDAYDDCFKGRDWRNPPDDWHGTCVKHMLAWAISEARKGE